MLNTVRCISLFSGHTVEGQALRRAPGHAECKALGVSMAVPVVKWIGEQIDMVEEVM